MVDVSDKPDAKRTAAAEAIVRLGAEAFALVRDGQVKKGDVLAVAQIAGIQAAKRTPELIPLCHPLPINGVSIDFAFDNDAASLSIVARVVTTALTGVEMEAMTAASVAALTVYDMCKSVTKGITIERVRLIEKTGGKSGDYRVG